jgi:ABC-type multidrug transport system ATPase subunit
LLIKKKPVNETIITTSAVSFRYSKAAAPSVSGLNLNIQRGSIYGFLGPNGSGKTTTLSLLTGLLKLQEGSITIFGQPLEKNRTALLKKIGCLIENPSLYGHLSARENLEVYRSIYGVSSKRIDQVLDIIRLGRESNKTVRKYSLGMKQRLAIGLAIMHQPELLILDEPTNGLDPSGIIELRELMRHLNREEGMTILLSSHILAEVEKIATHIGVIAKGRLLQQGSMEDLHQLQAGQSFLRVRTSDDARASALLQNFGPRQIHSFLTIPITHEAECAKINRLLVDQQIDVHLLQPIMPDLEQLFIDLTNSQI